MGIYQNGHIVTVIGGNIYLSFVKDALDIKKMNHRYVCSKERLDAIDFKIIRNYDYTFNKIHSYHSVNKYLIK